MWEYFIDNKGEISIVSAWRLCIARQANPITQLAFTLCDSHVEYYLSRGMHIDDFALTFPSFSAMEWIRVQRYRPRSRHIWAKAMREKYGANERAQN